MERRRRLGELILYIANKCAAQRNFGETKLNKILYFADFEMFRLSGRSITGARYRRLPYGPVPLDVYDVLDGLKKTGRATVAKETVGKLQQRRLVACAQADRSVFTSDELCVLDEVISRVCTMTANEVSELSHQTEGWKLAAPNSEIPYFTAFLPDVQPKLNRFQLAKAKALAQQALKAT